MNIRYIFCIIYSIIHCFSFIYGCPTCLGKVRQKSDPFFSKKFYELEKKHDELYNAQLQEKKKWAYLLNKKNRELAHANKEQK